MRSDSKSRKLHILALVAVIALIFSVTNGSCAISGRGTKNGQPFSVAHSDSLEIVTTGNDVTVRIDPKATEATVNQGVMVEGNGTTHSIVCFPPSGNERVDIILPPRFLSSLSISTVNGDIEIGQGLEAGTITLKSVSGNVDTHRMKATGSVSISTISGNLDMGKIDAFDIALNSVSSNIKASAKVRQGGNVQVVSTSGNIELDLRGTDNLSLSANSTSGKILANTNKVGGYHFSDKTGTGKTRVSARTMSGAIRFLY